MEKEARLTDDNQMVRATNNIEPANFLREENAGSVDTPLGCHQSELGSSFAIAVFTTQYPTHITKLVI